MKGSPDLWVGNVELEVSHHLFEGNLRIKTKYAGGVERIFRTSLNPYRRCDDTVSCCDNTLNESPSPSTIQYLDVFSAISGKYEKFQLRQHLHQEANLLNKTETSEEKNQLIFDIKETKVKPRRVTKG